MTPVDIKFYCSRNFNSNLVRMVAETENIYNIEGGAWEQGLPSSMFSTAYVIVFGLLLLSIRWLWKRPSYPCPLPPGPATEPLLGHARILPRKDPQTVFAEWAKEFGSR